jgi:hypothetical protein
MGQAEDEIVKADAPDDEADRQRLAGIFYEGKVRV